MSITPDDLDVNLDDAANEDTDEMVLFTIALRPNPNENDKLDLCIVTTPFMNYVIEAEPDKELKAYILDTAPLMMAELCDRIKKGGPKNVVKEAEDLKKTLH